MGHTRAGQRDGKIHHAPQNSVQLKICEIFLEISTWYFGAVVAETTGVGMTVPADWDSAPSK